MSSQPEFLSIKRQERLSVQAADQLAQMILDHTLPAGSRLPPERQMAESLGVSRTVVREAIRLLEARRLIEAKPGSGAIIRGFSSDPVSESISMLLGDIHAGVSFEDVQAVRSVLEIATVRLAAENATDDDLACISDALDRMVAAHTVETHLQADRDFHLAIAMATHNKVFVLLIEALIDIMMETWYAYWEPQQALGSSHPLAENPEQIESNRLHAQILEAIRAGDSPSVQRAMADMLEHWSHMYSSASPATTAPHH